MCSNGEKEGKVTGYSLIRVRPRDVGAALRVWVLASLIVLLPAAGLGAQEPEDGALRVGHRFDPVTDTYRVVVIPPVSPDVIRAAQQVLRSEGLLDTPATGVLDRVTRSALRDFQVDRGLRITGVLDYETAIALGLPLRFEPSASTRAGMRAPG
jgi:hypothetical protein